MFLFPACIAASAAGAETAAANTTTGKKNTNAVVKVPLQPVLYNSAGSRAAPAAKATGTEVQMLSFATASVLSRTFLRQFTATSLACEGIKKRENNGHPNGSSVRKVQQKTVDGRTAAASETASKQKHSQAREQLVASSMFPSVILTYSICMYICTYNCMYGVIYMQVCSQ